MLHSISHRARYLLRPAAVQGRAISCSAPTLIRDGDPFKSPPWGEDWTAQERQELERGMAWQWTQALTGGSGSAVLADAASPGELTVYRTTSALRLRTLATSGLLPLGIGATMLLGRWASVFPPESTPSYAGIGVWFLAAGALLSMTSKIARFTVREIIIANGGTHARLRTFRLLGGFGPAVTVPIHLIREKAVENADSEAFRYITLGDAEDRGYMMVHKRGEVLDPVLFEAVLGGDGPVKLPKDVLEEAGLDEDQVEANYARVDAARAALRRGEDMPVEEAGGSLGPVASVGSDAATSATLAAAAAGDESDPQGWRQAVDERGRTYYWHVGTRATRWTRPAGWTADMQAGGAPDSHSEPQEGAEQDDEKVWWYEGTRKVKYWEPSRSEQAWDLHPDNEQKLAALPWWKRQAWSTEGKALHSAPDMPDDVQEAVQAARERAKAEREGGRGGSGSQSS